MQQNSYFVEGKISKLLLKFSIPCVLSLLISALYNIVDQIFIGNSNVGTLGNTATSIVFPFTCLGLAFGLLLGDGTAAFMSLSMGKKENDKLSKSVGTGLIVGFIISAIYLLIAFPLLDKILALFGASTTEALNASHEYAIWILIGMPFSIMGNFLNPVIRADSSPKYSMISTIAGCLINIVLDYIFIYPLNMGLTGAALATALGQIATFIISLVYLFKPKSFKLKFKDLLINGRILLDILKLGFSSFLTQISIVIITIVSMNMLAKYGAQSKYGANDPQAIIGVIMKVFTIFVNIAVGIAAGAQPIVGYNYGANEFKRVKKIFKYVALSTLVVGVIATLLFQTIPVQIIKIFGSNSSNPELYLEFGEKGIRIYLLLIIFTLLQKITSIFLQSIGSPVKSTILSLIRDVITFVPFTICLPLAMGLDGVLWAAPCADIFGILFSVLFIILEFKKMNKLEKESELDKEEIENKIETQNN